MSIRPRPMALLILDGWGYSEDPQYNAVLAAKTPVWDRLWVRYPHTLIRTSGAAVGLPADQMGNSEVGHLNLGSGRVVYQEFTRVSRAIRTGSFYTNRTLTDAVDLAIENDKVVHILGLLSPGGVHSHEEQIHAMIKLAVERGAKHVYMHAFLDGRDTPPQSAESSLQRLDDVFAELGNGRIVSVIGRYYAMDRDHRWPRIKCAYDLIAHGQAQFSATTSTEALQLAYQRGESDEFVQATTIVADGGSPVKVEDGDVMVFMNYRSDRARQITRPFIDEDFDSFETGDAPRLSQFVSLTEYNSEFHIPVAFPSERMRNVFGDYLANLGMRQLRIAETEKYAHVTFFFNGGVEEPFSGEERILIDSPHVPTYDMQPEMSAPELTDKLVDAIHSGEYDVIICNYANPDMVGHTGNLEAATKAIESLDVCLGRVVEAIQHAGGEMMVTADHGNAEKMYSEETGQAHTAHTTNLVPFLYIGRDADMDSSGSLADVVPSMIYCMGIDKPSEMTGHSLVEFVEE
ncbi:MAG TPA: 2,3-bisphosphoglycerate-independent phosphoglycerate mutase [Gammaproteobacteria bacterium]|nr:2,3-bisphosphoglycerate-independent phosphoglycerate mutase [Gammaproteobacteria bacterium]